MSERKDYKFYVTELLQHPYGELERYVCVPNSWLIRLCETEDGLALVKCPVGELSLVKKLAEKKEIPESWTACLAYIKYGTNSYKGACHFIKTQNNISSDEQNKSKIVKDTSPKLAEKIFESQPGSETNDVDTTPTVIRNAEAISKISKMQPDLTNTEGKRCLDIIEKIKDASVNFKEHLINMPLSANKTNTVSLPVENARNSSQSTTNSEEINKTNHNKEKKKIPVENSQEFQVKLHTLVALRSVLGDNFREVLKQLHNEFERTSLIVEKLLATFVNNCKTIEEVIEITDKLTNELDVIDLDDAVKELEKKMVEVNINKTNLNEKAETVKELEKKVVEVNINKTNLNEKAETEAQNNFQTVKDNEDNSTNETDVKNKNPSNKIRGKLRKFTLPPEYDPNNSRWTLRHRKMVDGLVELIPKSRVYVDAIGLSKCKMSSKNSAALARMLLLEIFSKNALGTCSLTGQKPNAFNIEGRVRPGLDEKAINALFKYVKNHALSNNWPVFDKQLIKNTIRNKIQEIRGKCK